MEKSKAEANDKLLAWGRFFNAETEEEFEELAKTDKYLKSAYMHLKEISADEKKRQKYEARKKELLELKAVQDDGILIGREQGLAEGMQIGIEKGKHIREQQIIEKMRTEGFSEEQIRLICGA